MPRRSGWQVVKFSRFCPTGTVIQDNARLVTLTGKMLALPAGVLKPVGSLAVIEELTTVLPAVNWVLHSTSATRESD